MCPLSLAVEGLLVIVAKLPSATLDSGSDDPALKVARQRPARRPREIVTMRERMLKTFVCLIVITCAAATHAFAAAPDGAPDGAAGKQSAKPQAKAPRNAHPNVPPRTPEPAKAAAA